MSFWLYKNLILTKVFNHTIYFLYKTQLIYGMINMIGCETINEENKKFN